MCILKFQPCSVLFALSVLFFGLYTGHWQVDGMLKSAEDARVAVTAYKVKMKRLV